MGTFFAHPTNFNFTFVFLNRLRRLSEFSLPLCRHCTLPLPLPGSPIANAADVTMATTQIPKAGVDKSAKGFQVCFAAHQSVVGLVLASKVGRARLKGNAVIICIY